MDHESATRYIWDGDNRLAAIDYAHRDGVILTALEDDWERDSEATIIQAAMAYGWRKPDLALCVEDPRWDAPQVLRGEPPMIVDIVPYEIVDPYWSVLEYGYALLCYRVSLDELRSVIGG